VIIEKKIILTDKISSGGQIIAVLAIPLKKPNPLKNKSLE
jgi:hypothetical protein